jgi:hypothetical protein
LRRCRQQLSSVGNARSNSLRVAGDVMLQPSSPESLRPPRDPSGHEVERGGEADEAKICLDDSNPLQKNGIPAEGWEMREAKQIVVLAALALVLSSCPGARGSKGPTFPPPYSVVVAPDDNAPECGCTPSSKWVVTNYNKTHTKLVKLRRVVTDTSTGNVILDETPSLVLGPEKSEILECAVVDPAENPACQRKIEYRKIDEVAIKSRDDSPDLFVGSLFFTELPNCLAACENPASPLCYRLGSRSTALLVPLLALYESAKEKHEGVIVKQALLDRYNVAPEKEACARGDIEIQGDNLLNDSAQLANEDCVLEGNDAAIRVRLPKAIAARLEGSRSFNSVSAALRFEDNNTAAWIEFASGGAKNDLQQDFGGSVRAMAETATNMVIATTNGCLRVEKQ